MGLLSSSVSINRYYVEGKIQESVLEVVTKGLKKYSFKETEEAPSDKISGWTSFNNHFKPDFESSSFVLGDYFVFSLRIDKKSVSSKIIKKYLYFETLKRLEESGRSYLSANEKKFVKEHVVSVLLLRVPATPNIYDVVWDYEKSMICFFSNNKSVNEEFETLFQRSFNKHLIKIFPYSEADILSDLSDQERDTLSHLSLTKFME
ncbi:MAG: recombination-associated protein RdgC [Proteobacteria bacterium]|nr:recombination-associated protein RdgC [Pseudomonadota bacterium]